MAEYVAQADVGDNAHISGYAVVEGKVLHHAYVTGSARVGDYTTVSMDAVVTDEVSPFVDVYSVNGRTVYKRL